MKVKYEWKYEVFLGGRLHQLIERFYNERKKLKRVEATTREQAQWKWKSNLVNLPED